MVFPAEGSGSMRPLAACLYDARALYLLTVRAEWDVGETRLFTSPVIYWRTAVIKNIYWPKIPDDTQIVQICVFIDIRVE